MSRQKKQSCCCSNCQQEKIWKKNRKHGRRRKNKNREMNMSSNLDIDIPDFVWQVNISNDFSPHAITTAISGDFVFLLGLAQGKIKFNKAVVLESTQTTLFLTKFDKLGRAIWVSELAMIGPTENINITTLSGLENLTGGFELVIGIDAIYIATGNGTPWTLPDGIQVNSSDGAQIIISLNSNGEFQWYQQIEDSIISSVYIDVDNADNLYVSANMDNKIKFDDKIEFITAMPETFYIAQIDIDGNWLQATIAETGCATNVTSLSAYADGQLYITGNYNESLILGDLRLASDIQTVGNFIAKTDNRQTFIFLKEYPTLTVSTNNSLIFTDSGLSSNNELYISANIKGLYNIDGAPIITETEDLTKTIILLKLDQMLDTQWLRLIDITNSINIVNDPRVSVAADGYGSLSIYFANTPTSIEIETRNRLILGRAMDDRALTGSYMSLAGISKPAILTKHKKILLDNEHPSFMENNLSVTSGYSSSSLSQSYSKSRHNINSKYDVTIKSSFNNIFEDRSSLRTSENFTSIIESAVDTFNLTSDTSIDMFTETITNTLSDLIVNITYDVFLTYFNDAGNLISPTIIKDYTDNVNNTVTIGEQGYIVGTRNIINLNNLNINSSSSNINTGLFGTSDVMSDDTENDMLNNFNIIKTTTIILTRLF